MAVLMATTRDEEAACNEAGIKIVFKHNFYKKKFVFLNKFPYIIHGVGHL